MNQASTPPQTKLNIDKDQEPLSEVEIQTGNRAESVHFRSNEKAKAPAPAGSPLAVRRRRAAERRLLTWLLLTCLALVLTVWGTAKWWQPLLNGDVVARVNGRAITYQQVDKELRLGKALSVASTGKEQSISAPAMLEQLILIELEVQAAGQAGFNVSPQDVDASIARIVRQAGAASDKLDEALRRYGVTRDDLYASLARTTLADQFAQRDVAGIAVDKQTGVARINAWQADLVQKARIERLRGAEAGVGPRVGMAAPDFTLRQIGGKDVQLNSLRGKAVMVYVWAPWCPACRAEVPIMEKAYKVRRPVGNRAADSKYLR